MDTNYEMLQKSQTHDMMAGCLWVCRKLGSPCSRVPAAVALLRCFSLHALLAKLAVPAPSHLHLGSGWSAGRLGGLFLWSCSRERVGEGLQSWHEAKAKWTADSWAFHCSCAELPTLSTSSSACRDCHSCPIMSNPHVTIQPALFYMFA